MEKLKKLFAAAAAVVLSFGAFAEMTAKVVVQDGGKTLRFVYDETDYGKKGTDWYSVAEGEVDDGRWDVKDVMPWCEIKRNITKVIFDPSFKDYRPSSCYQWFLNCSRLKSFEGLTNLDTSEATNLGCMFMGCSKLMTLDLSHLNTSRVHNFSFMFAACTSLFRVDVSGFDTRVGQFMEKMFFMCRKLQTLNLSSFNTQYVVFMEEMFSGCSELETIVVSELFAICTLWTNDNGIDMFRDCEMLVGGNGNKYSAMQTDATYACIDSNFGRGYFTGIVSPKVVYDREAGLLKFVYDDKGYGKKDVDWFSVREAEERAKSGKLPVWIHKAYMSVRKVVIDGTFSHYRPKSCYAWFHLLQLTKGLENLRCLDTSEVTDMRFMFNMCIVWTDLDFSQFKTSKVVDMASMFDRFTYEGAKLDLSSFNTSNVTNMNGLFRKATVRRIDCASFNTTAVTDMTEMFRDNSKLQVIYGPDSFSTSALKPGCDQDMFTGCKNLASVGGIGTKYSDGHTDSTYARVDDDGTPGYFSAKMISVTFEGNGGLFKETGTAKLIRKYQMGKGIDSFPEPIRSGYQLISWRTYQSGVDSDHLTKDVTYQAQWLSDEEVDERNSASSQDPNVPCAVIHFHAMDGIFEDYDTDELCYKYPLGLSYDWLPTPTANTAGQQLYCWFDLDAGEIVEADDIVTESRTLYACYYTPKVKTVYFYDLEFQQSPCYEVEVGCSAYLPAPRTKTGYTFAGWFSEENGGGKKFVNGKAPTSSDTAFYAYWQKNAEPDAPEPVVWTQNRYGCAELSTLGVDLPADVSTVKKVTIEGAVKDLKLVQDKAKTKWYLEGVPKETLDGKTRTMAARIAFKEKGKADSVQTLLLSIVADKHTTAQMNLNAVYVKDAAELFGVDAFDANWDVTGLAANLKYAKKATTWKDSSKTSHDIPAYAIYGQPNKLCAMTLVGKRKVTSEVPDSKTTHVELYSAEVLVRPESGMYDRMVKLNAQEEALYDVAADYGWATDTKTKASTPPSGLKFTNKETKSGKTTVPAGSFYGKPTKTGYFPVTLTGPNKETANYLVWIVNPEAPDVGCYFGSASKKLAKKVKAGGSAEEQTQKLELMVGASFDFPLIVTEGATVKQSGLPTGLKLAQDKTTKRWTIAGVPTKAGTYYATVTATKNGAATTVSYLFEVIPNAFAGEWRGYLFSAGESQAWRRHLAGLTVNVAAGGATKVTLAEKGTASSYSLKSFTWDDLNGNATIAFTTKATKDYSIVREVTLELVNQGGWYALRGDVHYQESGEYAGYAEAYPVVPLAELNAHGVLSGLVATHDWIFTEDKNGNGNIRQVAVLSTALDAKKGVAKVAGLLGEKNGGSETKLAVASLPIVRLGDDADDLSSYAFAPFAGYDKVCNTTTLFTLALDGSDFDVFYDIRDELLVGRDTIACTAVEALSKGKPIADSLSASGLVLCDFYTHSSTCFKIAATGKGKFEVYDTLGNKLAALSAKFGADGLGTISFTTADKLCKYTLTVFDCGNGTLTGSVTLAEKSDGTTYTYVGLVDIY